MVFFSSVISPTFKPSYPSSPLSPQVGEVPSLPFDILNKECSFPSVIEVMEVQLIKSDASPPALKMEKTQIQHDSEFIARVDDYRYANRIPTRSEAIRRLVRKGLEAERNERA